MKVRTQGQVVKMVVILVEEEKMREILVVVVGVVDRSPSPTLPREGTEKLKPTIKLKVDDGKIAVLPFIICLF